MTILAEGELHGYRIVERAANTPTLAGTKPDAAGVYRLLHSMEARGLVTSSWDTSGGGPAKRRYRLTPAGVRCLERWAETLAAYRRMLARLARAARAASARLANHIHKERRQ